MFSPLGSRQFSPAHFDRDLYAPLLKEGKFQDILIALQPLVAAGPTDPQLMFLVADCYFGLKRMDRGLHVLEAITSHWPNNLQAWGKLGSHRLLLGDRTGAAQAYRSILTQRPQSALALSALYICEPFGWYDPQAETLRQCLADGKLSQEERISAQNTLGKCAASAGLTDEAFDAFQASKAETPGDYDASEMETAVAAQISEFAPELLPEVPLAADGPQPVFLLGLPGSGTDLLETMLLAHPEICTLGESPALVQTRRALQHHIRQNNPFATDWAWCHETSAKLAYAGRKAYFNLLPQTEIAGANVALDKLPQNLFEIGFARMILPEARFVFMMSHPLDLGLSLFATNFHKGHYYSHRLDWIGEMIRSSYAALDDYLAKLGPRLRLQSHRRLLEDPETQMRAIFSHLGLHPAPECLKLPDQNRPISTATLMQAQQEAPISEIGFWQPYEDHLAPLIDALGGWDWIRSWEARENALT